MRSGKERYQKDCLNCGSHVLGRYCQACGQENIEPSQSAWSLFFHFFSDLFHFDGKFFSTLKYMFFYPGKVSHDYRTGKRKRYLNPVRMYLFTSAVFFIIFFSLFNIRNRDLDFRIEGKRASEISKMGEDSLRSYAARLGLPQTSTRADIILFTDSLRHSGKLHISDQDYDNRAEFDSLIKAGAVDHSWLEKQFIYKQIELNNRFDTGEEAVKELLDNWLHTLPKVLFISLPLFALLLKIVYVKRRDLFYTDHLVFSTYLYIMLFILAGLLIFGYKAEHLLSPSSRDWFLTILVLVSLIYEYKSIRNFYKSSRIRSFLNLLFINFLHILLVLLLFVIFLLISLINL